MKERIKNIISIIDIPNLLVAIASIISWQCVTTSKTHPQYVPPNSQQFSYPNTKEQAFTRQVLEYTVFFVGLDIILLLFLLHRFLPKYFYPIRFFSTCWIFLACVGLCNTIANSLKGFVGRPRPDMYSVCGDNANYDTCISKKRDKEFISWPSTHASMSMSGLLFSSLIMLGSFRKPHLYLIVIALLPTALSIYIGATRIREYKHHTEDVTAGFFFGALFANIFFWSMKKKIFPKIKKRQGNGQLIEPQSALVSIS